MHASGRRTLCFGTVCGGAGERNPHRRRVSRGGTVVSGGVSAHRLRLRLLSTLERSAPMNIVVWKSPKALRGIFRRLFGIKGTE